MIAFHLTADGAVHQAPPWRQRSLLLALGAIHVLAFLMWPAARRVTHAVVDQSRITYLLPVLRPAASSSRPPAREKPASPVQRPAPASQPVSVRPAMPEPVAITLPPAEPAAQPAPPDPFAVPPAKADAADLKQRAKLSAGAIDKQMRKESWNPHNKFVANEQTALAAAMGAAYRGNDGGTSMEDIVQSDGRVMTRVRLPNGATYCAQKETNGATGGRDPFRDGIKTKVMSCPR